jgi:hypothetical protein
MALVTGAVLIIAAVPGRAAAGGERLWVKRYNEYTDSATAIAVSPDGSMAFVTGNFQSFDGVEDHWITLGLDASTGARRWSMTHGVSPYDSASDIAVSPDGATVFVTGATHTSIENGLSDYGTIAYDATTGAEIWTASYDGGCGCPDGGDGASDLAVSPDGSTVFVTGTIQVPGTDPSGGPLFDDATVAYDAATGAERWVSPYDGGPSDLATSVAVSPTGSTVFVTGDSVGTDTRDDFVTLAYASDTGDLLWTSAYRGTARKSVDIPSTLVTGPQGSRVFVTGRSQAPTEDSHFATVAFSATTGERLWARTYDGPGTGDDGANDIAVSPTSRRLFVGGSSAGSDAELDCTVVAYRSATGERLWVTRVKGTGRDADVCRSVVTSPDGSEVFAAGLVTDQTPDYLTAAMRAAGGKVVWRATYDGPVHGIDSAADLAVGPGRGRHLRVFVTGTSAGTVSEDLATLAYTA